MIELNIAHLIVAFITAIGIPTAVTEWLSGNLKKELDKNRQLKNLKY